MKITTIMAAAWSLAIMTACSPGHVKTMENSRMQLLQDLMSNAESGRIAYGHQDDLCYGHSWVVTDWENDPLERSDVKDVCGHFPALVGFDLGGIELGDEANLDGVPFGLMRKAALKHLERGGMVTFSWHPRNPLTGGDAWDISSDQVVKSILPGGEKHGEFMSWLKRAADFIQSLGPEAPVIFRPWHENIGSWFWWGGKLCTAGEYKDLFRLTRAYFEKERGIRNIIWCYSPNGNASAREYSERYPGDEFVDLLGIDTYEFVGEGGLEEARIHFQHELMSALEYLTVMGSEHRKPICLSETGLEGLVDPEWWTKALYPAIKDYPVSYVLTWRNAHDKPGHFYAPWPGFESAPDFTAFTELEQIVVL
ncbi:MAG: beta-mannosidase [Bacteroidales bacterium]|nr:beta-mannosidase [Bacteroidales bacterium]